MANVTINGCTTRNMTSGTVTVQADGYQVAVGLEDYMHKQLACRRLPCNDQYADALRTAIKAVNDLKKFW